MLQAVDAELAAFCGDGLSGSAVDFDEGCEVVLAGGQLLGELDAGARVLGIGVGLGVEDAEAVLGNEGFEVGAADRVFIDGEGGLEGVDGGAPHGPALQGLGQRDEGAGFFGGSGGALGGAPSG